MRFKQTIGMRCGHASGMHLANMDSLSGLRQCTSFWTEFMSNIVELDAIADFEAWLFAIAEKCCVFINKPFCGVLEPCHLITPDASGPDTSYLFGALQPNSLPKPFSLAQSVEFITPEEVLHDFIMLAAMTFYETATLAFVKTTMQSSKRRQRRLC